MSFLKANALFQAFNDTILTNLISEMEWIGLPAGEYLFRQGDPGDFLYLVYQGGLHIIIKKEDGSEITVAEVGAGKPLGEIQFLSGGNRTASVMASHPSELLRLSKQAFDRLAEKNPEILHQMAEIIRQRLRRDQLVSMLPLLCGPVDTEMLHSIESETEWIWLPEGEVLFRAGDVGDSFFLLISGRLSAAVYDADGNEKIVGEVRRGEIVGEMSLFTGDPRSATIYAARSSELVKFSKVAFERLTSQYPAVIMHIVQIIVKRLQQSQSTSSAAASGGLNIAIIPANEETPISEFTRRLITALAGFEDILYLQSEQLDQMLNMPGVAQTPEYAPNNVRLAAWLDEQETKYQILVYETDKWLSPWTKRCIQRADRILIVANASSSPEAGDVKRILQIGGKRLNKTRRTLVMLHPDSTKLPSGTREWLNRWEVDDHYHVRWDVTDDFERLSRVLTGHAVGLVLGGGGARGCAHIGVVRALTELGIPIDMVGGTSIGAAMAALYAMGTNYDEMIRINRFIWVHSKPFNDYTLPLLSLIKGRRFEHLAQQVYGERPIEDLWINYFCVSANITTAETVVHQNGPLWKALRATASLPGIAVPLIQGKNLLVDGGVLNNLPVDVMRDLCGGGFIIAVNVSPERDLSVNFHQFPSPWRVLWQRLVSAARVKNVPNILDLLLRATMVGSIHQTNAVKQSADLYLQPPVERFKLLDFRAIDEIASVGYEYTRQQLENWTLD